MPTENETTKLLRKIAPADIGGHPLYLAFSSSLPRDLRPPESVWGMHSPALDLGLRAWLESRGEWRGRGPAIVVNDLSIRLDAWIGGS